MKTINRIIISSKLANETRELAKHFQDRLFICYYPVKRNGQRVPREEKICLIQKRSMDQIRKESPEFSRIASVFDNDNNEYMLGFGISLEGSLKLYRDEATGSAGLKLASLPGGPRLLEVLSDDKKALEYLRTFAESRILLSKIRWALDSKHVNTRAWFIPISYPFFKSEDNKVMKLFIVEGATLHQVELRPAGRNSYRFDFRVKGYEVLSISDLEKTRFNKSVGFYLPITDRFEENPRFETSTMSLFAASKSFLLPRLAFTMEEHIGKSHSECLNAIKDRVKELSNSEFTKAIYFSITENDKTYQHFLVSQGNLISGNLIPVRKMRPEMPPMEKYDLKQKAAKILRASLSKLEEMGDLKIETIDWIKQRQPITQHFLYKTPSKKAKNRTYTSLELGYEMSESAPAVESFAWGLPKIVYCKDETSLEYLAHKVLALDNGSVTQMTQEPIPQSVLNGTADNFYESNLRMRFVLKEACLEMAKTFQEQSYRVDEMSKFLSLKDIDTGLSESDRVSFLIPIGGPFDHHAGLVLLTTTLKDYFFDGSFEKYVIDKPKEASMDFSKALARVLKDRMGPGTVSDHFIFFTSAKRYSQSWQVEKAIEQLDRTYLSFIPSTKETTALIDKSTTPNQSIGKEFYLSSEEPGRLQIILDTTLPPPPKSGMARPDRYCFQVWDLQMPVHYSQEVISKLRKAFLTLHYKTQYVSANLPLGQFTTIALIKKLKELIEYPLKVCQSDSFGPAHKELLKKTYEKLRLEYRKCKSNNSFNGVQPTSEMLSIQERGKSIKALIDFIVANPGSCEGPLLSESYSIKAIKCFMKKNSLNRFPLGVLS